MQRTSPIASVDAYLQSIAYAADEAILSRDPRTRVLAIRVLAAQIDTLRTLADDLRQASQFDTALRRATEQWEPLIP